MSYPFVVSSLDGNQNIKPSSAHHSPIESVRAAAVAAANAVAAAAAAQAPSGRVEIQSVSGLPMLSSRVIPANLSEPKITSTKIVEPSQQEITTPIPTKTPTKIPATCQNDVMEEGSKKPTCWWGLVPSVEEIGTFFERHMSNIKKNKTNESGHSGHKKPEDPHRFADRFLALPSSSRDSARIREQVILTPQNKQSPCKNTLRSISSALVSPPSPRPPPGFTASPNLNRVLKFNPATLYSKRLPPTTFEQRMRALHSVSGAAGSLKQHEESAIPGINTTSWQQHRNTEQPAFLCSEPDLDDNDCDVADDINITKPVSCVSPTNAFSHIEFDMPPLYSMRVDDVSDNFYTRMVDWGPNNMVALGSRHSVRLFDPVSKRTSVLFSDWTNDSGSEIITAVAWAPNGRSLAVGMESGIVQLWDINSATTFGNRSGALVSQIKCVHRGPNVVALGNRVQSVSWNSSVLSVGLKGGTLVHSDYRAFNIPICVVPHAHEISGIQWTSSTTASSGVSMLATGSATGRIRIWDARTGLQRWMWQFHAHESATKALAWNPSGTVLASGGGSKDQCVRFWDPKREDTNKCIRTIMVNSQVCALSYTSPSSIAIAMGYYRNMVSLHKTTCKEPENTTHDAIHDNPVAVLRRPDDSESRMLHLSVSPDGRSACTLSASGTFSQWNLNPFTTQEED